MGSEEASFLMDLGGAAQKSVRLARRHASKALGSRKPSSVADSLVAANYRAHLGASAERASVENMRPNRMFSLVTATPATAIASNNGTGNLSVTIPGNAYICAFYATAADEADFLITSLKVNGYETIGTSTGINLAAFLATAGRIDRPGPLVGRKFSGNVTVEGNFLNTNSASKVFHGLVIATIAPECGTNGDAGSPAPGIFNWNHMKKALTGLLPRRK
jgi:hypothetical protein